MDRLQEFEQLLTEARYNFKNHHAKTFGSKLLNSYRDLTFFIDRNLSDKFNFGDVDQMIRFNNDDIANQIRNELSDNNG